MTDTDADRSQKREGAVSSGSPPVEAFTHEPVLLAEVVRLLQPSAGQTVVDATLGAGGHAEQLVRGVGPGGRVVGVDRDPAALRAAAARLEPVAAAAAVRVDFVRADYARLAEVLEGLGLDLVDGVLFDCGVSSPQFDDPARGFTYRTDAELDMRMDPDQALTAYHLVNGLSEEELAGIIRRYGEERWAARIATFIVRRRRERGMIATTGELVDVILAAVPASARRRGPHPARRTFQALRIAVNGELDALETGLRAAVERLRPGGRVAAIAFHSLEDRIVKHVFRELSRGCTCPPDWPVCRCGHVASLSVVAGHPVQAGAEEVERNPRARSAKLRAAVRLPQGDGRPAGGGEGPAARPRRRSEGRGSVGTSAPRAPRGGGADAGEAERGASGLVAAPAPDARPLKPLLVAEVSRPGPRVRARGTDSRSV